MNGMGEGSSSAKWIVGLTWIWGTLHRSWRNIDEGDDVRRNAVDTSDREPSGAVSHSSTRTVSVYFGLPPQTWQNAQCVVTVSEMSTTLLTLGDQHVTMRPLAFVPYPRCISKADTTI